MSNNWKQKYIRLWCGQGASLITSAILQMSIVWYITEQTGSALVLAAGTICTFLPQTIFGPFIGVYIDRFKRKSVMIVSDIAISLLSLSLCLAGYIGGIPISLILVVLLLRSIGTAFQQPSFEALIATLVPKDRMVKYAGYSQSFKSLSMILSPALGATFYSLWGLTAVIFIDAIGTIIGVILVFTVKLSEDVPKRDSLQKHNQPHLIQEFTDGIKIIKQTKGILAFAVIGSVYALFYVPVGSMFPFMVITHFNGSVAASGIVEIFFASGTLIGSLCLARVAYKINKFMAIFFSILVYGLGSMISGLFPSEWLYIFIPLTFFMGLASPFFFGTKTAIYQIILPKEYLGRAFSIDNSIRMISMPVSLIISGIAEEFIGIAHLFFLCGLFTIILALVTLFIPSLKNVCKEAKMIEKEESLK